MEFKHIPIMLDEVIDGLNIKEDGTYLDGTLGGAGHSIEIIKRLKNGQLIGIDQDENALKKAREVLADYSDQVVFVKDNYKNIDFILKELNIDKIDGILLDIGVSSHQFDEVSRGFSHNHDAPLDMRMDRTQGLTAWDIVNKYSKEELNDIIFNFGEDGQRELLNLL